MYILNVIAFKMYIYEVFMQEQEIIYSKNLPRVWRDEITVKDSLTQTLIFSGKIPEEVNLKIRLAEKGARGEITFVYLGKEKNSTQINIILIHEAPDTYGRISLKAALFDESRLNFRGMLEIGTNAKGADSYLSAKVLLVSPQARAEIYPQLEIKTDEVKASHGSSIGRIEENQLFYLQSRGIKKEAAQNIILSEFFKGIPKEVFSKFVPMV